MPITNPQKEFARLSCRAYDAGHQYADAQQRMTQMARNTEQVTPQFEQIAMHSA